MQLNLVAAPTKRTFVRRSHGFSLLEVLVTLVLVAIGLLGVAGMQVAAIRLGDAADIRSKGSTFIDAIAERIQTNPNNAAAYAVSLTGSVSAGAAAADVTAWKASIAQALTNGQGSITVTPDGSCPAVTATSRVCNLVTIVVQWSEIRAKRTSVGATPETVVFQSVVRV